MPPQMMIIPATFLPKRDDLLPCIHSDHSIFEEEECSQKKEKRFAFSIACESESRYE